MEKTKKCDEHPNYQAKRRPVDTKKHSGGCKECWKMFNDERLEDNEEGKS